MTIAQDISADCSRSISGRHEWTAVSDSEGDFTLPGGTQHFSYYQCACCGEETSELPDEEVLQELDYPDNEPEICGRWYDGQ